MPTLALTLKYKYAKNYLQVSERLQAACTTHKSGIVDQIIQFTARDLRSLFCSFLQGGPIRNVGLENGDIVDTIGGKTSGGGFGITDKANDGVTGDSSKMDNEHILITANKYSK